MEAKMNLFNFNPTKFKKLDPRKYGYDYGYDIGSIVFDSNFFKQCSSCRGTGEIRIKERKKPRK